MKPNNVCRKLRAYQQNYFQSNHNDNTLDKWNLNNSNSTGLNVEIGSSSNLLSYNQQDEESKGLMKSVTSLKSRLKSKKANSLVNYKR